MNLVSMLFPMALHAWLLQLASVAPKASSVRALADLRRSTAKSKGPSPRRRSRQQGATGVTSYNYVLHWLGSFDTTCYNHERERMPVWQPQLDWDLNVVKHRRLGT